jgi:peptidoglycan/xylan/chitin deacetylase (PgdA/CDA1 family)
MSESQVRELSQSFEIGGHTLDHVFLPTITDSRAREQIAGSKKWIEDTTGKACEMFCPPAGRFSEAHRAMIIEAKYVGFRTVELLSISPPTALRGLLEMPTSLQSYPHRPTTYLKKAVKRKAWKRLFHYVSQGAPSDWENTPRDCSARWQSGQWDARRRKTS